MNKDKSPDLNIAILNCVRNIAGCSVFNRVNVIKAGILVPLSEIFKQYVDDYGNIWRTKMINSALMTFAGLTQGRPGNPFSLLEPFLPFLKKTLFDKEESIVCNTLWAYYGFTEQTDAEIDRVAEEGITSRLVELLRFDHCPNFIMDFRSPSKTVHHPALSVIGNLLYSDTPAHTATFIKEGILDDLKKFLEVLQLCMISHVFSVKVLWRVNLSGLFRISQQTLCIVFSLS
jgi:hypothetical protein